MKNPKTFYIREQRRQYPDHYRGKPVACVVYERHPDPDVAGSDYVIFAYSIARPDDEFRKIVGRQMATIRLKQGYRLPGFCIESEATASDVVRQIMQVMLTEPKIPRRVLGHINNWLYQGAVL